jgi:hypothetical protein
MFLTTESVGDIPVDGPGLAGHTLTTLDVLRLRLRATTDVGAYRCSSDSTTYSGDIVTASTADLMTKHATDYATDNRSRNVVPA